MKKEFQETTTHFNNNASLSPLTAFSVRCATTPRIDNSGNLDRSLEKIQEKYGTDLRAFFQDVYKSIATNQEPDDRL